MNGTTLPKFYENHTPPAGYYDEINPEMAYTPTMGFNLMKLTQYAKSVNKLPNDLTWEELQMFRVEK